MSFCAKACSRLTRISQLASRQNTPPPTRTGGIRGTLVPSVKVARTTSNWFSMPQMPPLSGPTSSWLWNSPPRKVASRLRIDRLFQLQRIGSAARRMRLSSQVLPVSRRKMKPLNLRVVAGDFEPQRPGRPPQPDLDRFRGFDAEIGIADVEGGGRIMRAARKQLGRFRRAFDILRGDAGDQIVRQVLDQADAGALRREVRIARRGGPMLRDRR